MLKQQYFANCHLSSSEFLTHMSRPDQKLMAALSQFPRSFQILNLERDSNGGVDIEKSLHLY